MSAAEEVISNEGGFDQVSADQENTIVEAVTAATEISLTADETTSVTEVRQ